MNKYVLTVLTVFVVMQSLDAFAAGAAVKRRQQMQQMQAMQQQAIQEAVMQQQQQAQGQAQAQQIAQYQAAQQQAQAQAIAQYQQQQMQAQVQQILAQVQQQQVAYAQAKAIRQQQVEIVDAQQMALATSMAAKYQEAIMQEAAKQKLVFTAVQMAQIQQLAQAQAEMAVMQTMQAKDQAQAQALVAGQIAQRKPVEQYQIEDVVDITDVWRKLDVDSRSWTLLVDEQAKVATVSEYMDRFRKTGIKIQGSPNGYVQLIDQMAVENPSLLTNPFKNILQLVAVMQYDFDNGMDKDILARTMLGQQMYESNKRRLGR